MDPHMLQAMDRILLRLWSLERRRDIARLRRVNLSLALQVAYLTPYWSVTRSVAMRSTLTTFAPADLPTIVLRQDRKWKLVGQERAADTFPNLVTDIGKAVNPIHVSWEKPTITIIEDVYKANMAVKQLQESHDEMTIDIEVGIDSERHFGHPEQYKMLCIGISYKPGFVVVFGENVCANRGFEWRFANLLRDKKWICHNGKFDIAGLLGYCKVLGHLHFDTMLASYVLDERPDTHGLKYLAQELLGAPPYADEISKYVTAKESYAIIPRPVLY